MRHGAGRINLLRRLECPNCGAVIEAEEEVETLVEVFLRFGRVCGDLSRVRPQTFEEGLRRRAIGVNTDDQQHENETADKTGSSHRL